MNNHHERFDVYWANTFFSTADRSFNNACVEQLRAAGYVVFSPQETDTNAQRAPEASEIFRTDTVALLHSRCVIACIDQESIDGGVACEVGLAYAYGLPVFGLCTDIRQRRQGRFQLYRNPYVVGIIEEDGRIFASFAELVSGLSRRLGNAGDNLLQRRSDVIKHFSAVAGGYDDFVEQLESWHERPPDWGELARRQISQSASRLVLDYGCGTGRIGECVMGHSSAVEYFGYDASPEMLQIARRRLAGRAHYLTSQRSDVADWAHAHPFDLVLSFFVLHDIPDLDGELRAIAGALREGGLLLVADLGAGDLPLLAEALRRGLGRPAVTPERRLTLGKLSEQAAAAGLQLVRCEVFAPAVQFPTASDVQRYLGFFGVYCGDDMPLALNPEAVDTTERRVQALLGSWTFPLRDRREFLVATFTKT
ncbi:MAG: nucleoside 2-deoxyribosyltransferase [Actinomycetia bacterium]|nr:nucleoside 2-deoxyribosyltransferase [Actinomycetes bacterium]